MAAPFFSLNIPHLSLPPFIDSSWHFLFYAYFSSSVRQTQKIVIYAGRRMQDVEQDVPAVECLTNCYILGNSQVAGFGDLLA